jgi:hypothetical protein
MSMKENLFPIRYPVTNDKIATAAIFITQFDRLFMEWSRTGCSVTIFPSQLLFNALSKHEGSVVLGHCQFPVAGEQNENALPSIRGQTNFLC